MKVCVLVYHKNLHSFCKPEWVKDFKKSILNQSYTGFDILELNYGGGDERIFDNSFFKSKELPTFAHAMNFLFDKAMEMGYDAVGNTNVDDVFYFNRIEKQIQYIEAGYDVVSSNFRLFKEDKVYHEHFFDKLDIRKELAKNHNVVCHPVLMWSSKFICHNRYDPDQIPFEDMLLWKKTMWDYRFVILEDFLCNHRIHDKSVGHNLKEV